MSRKRIAKTQKASNDAHHAAKGGRPRLFAHKKTVLLRLELADYERTRALVQKGVPLSTWMRSVILAEIEKLEKAQKGENS